MSYGVLIKNANTNEALMADNLNFYPTQRGSISTSDTYYFSTINFNSRYMDLSFVQYGNLIGDSTSNPFSFMNFDLNSYNFYAVGINVTKPTVIELCKITSYEIGVGQTVYSSDFINNSKYLRNYSDPGNIYVKTSDYPTGFQTSYFGKALNYSYPTSGIQHFIYTSYEDSKNPKYFLAVPLNAGATIPNNFSWYEIPDDNFYHEINFYITIRSGTFNGSSLSLSSFKGIIPKSGNTILISYPANDIFSGLYTIKSITNSVNLSKGFLKFNYPGQTFHSKINLDTSTSTTYYEAVHFVPFEYGYAAECFTKNLSLTLYSCAEKNTPNYFPPLFHDKYNTSMMKLSLANKTNLTSKSDSFLLGIAVSNWFPDSKLFGIALNYQIKEGYSTNIN